SFRRSLHSTTLLLPRSSYSRLLVLSRLSLARPRGSFLRRQGASLESGGVGDLSARGGRRAVGCRRTGGPVRGATGTREPVPRVAHRCRDATCRPLPPSAACCRPLGGAGLGGDQGPAAGVHARGLAPLGRPRRRLDQPGGNGLNC